MPATLAVLGILGSVAGVVVVFGRGLRSRGGPPVVVVGSWWVISRKRLNEGNEKKCKIGTYFYAKGIIIEGPMAGFFLPKFWRLTEALSLQSIEFFVNP